MRIFTAFLTGVACLALIVTGGWLYLQKIDQQALLTHYLTRHFERTVTFGHFHMTLSNPAYVEINDMQLANQPWGSTAAMVTLRHLEAEFNPWTLLGGRLVLNKLAIDGLVVTLERDPNGIGNWKKPGMTPPIDKTEGELLAEGLRQRRLLPVLRDLSLKNSLITFRTSGQALLKVGLNDVTLQSADEDQPIYLSAAGAYNNAPVKLEVTADSFAALHDTGKAFHADIHTVGADSDVRLDAAMMDPLNFDAVKGGLHVASKKLGPLMDMFGADFHADWPLELGGALEHTGNQWRITDAAGKFADSHFKGELALTEGARLKPDSAQADLAIDQVDAGRLLAGGRSGARKTASPNDDLPEIDTHPGMLLVAKLAIKNLRYHGLTLADLKTHVKIEQGLIALDDLLFSLFGGQAQGDITARAIKQGDHLDLAMAFVNIDIAHILKMAGVALPVMSGRLNAHFAMAGQGHTLSELAQSLQGHILIGAQQGLLSRKDFRLASVDLRAILGENNDQTMAQLYCLLGVANISDGIAFIAPFRLKTSEGVLFGGGTINLPQRSLDLSLKTERNSNSILALDLPLHLTGDFDNMHVTPQFHSAIQSLKDQAPGNLAALPAAMRAVAENNACAL